MPWFMIINLVISTMVVGLVFNFDFKIYKSIRKNLELKVEKPEVQADTASTTVKVRNAPPAITTPPAESPSSTTTSPVNVGSAISFTVTANDPENNSYYLIVCSSDSVTASSTGGAPTCGALELCVSGITPDTNQAACTYENVLDPPGEIRNWWAFVCDNHATEGECSETDKQGSGDSGSPFYINHAPTYTAIATIDNNKDPGGIFTVRASTTDADIARGAEVLHLYICSTDSWATSTGCSVMQLCHATSTSPDVDCSFATDTPAIDGDYTYYAFVRDDFYMPAPQNSRNSTYHVNNVAPTVSAVKIQSDNPIEVNLKNAAEVLASTTSASVTDNNGCTDIVNATGTIYWSSVANANRCTSNYNNCYQMGVTSCSIIAGTCTGPSDSILSLICTTTIAFHAIPTDNSTSNPNASTNWLAGIQVFDEALSGIATTVTGVDLITNTALDVTELEIPYGTIRAGLNTGTSTATTTIINFGNSPLDSYVYGTNMTGPGTLSIVQQQHNLTAYFPYGTGTSATSTLPGNLENTDISRPTSQTNVSDYIYWGIGIPGGTTSGDYSGVNTFTGSLDTSGSGW